MIGNILSDIFESSTTPSVPVTWETRPTVHPNDQEAVEVIKPHLEMGPWIAGGAPLRWYQNMPVGENDIDIFCRDALQAAEVVNRIKLTGRWSTRYESENAITLDYWPHKEYSNKWTLQIITRRYFTSIQDVIDNFDITVCEIATCGNEWVMNQWTARDINNKTLNFKEPLQPDALKRLVKYWTYGYTPLHGTIQAIQNNPTAKWKFNPEDDYNNALGI